MNIEQINDVSTWWVERPAGARLTPRAALTASLIILTLFVSTLVWVHARGEKLWPWSTVTPAAPSIPQYMLRYLYVLVAGLIYVLLTSAPAWFKLARVARDDLNAAVARADAEQWDLAALHLHRHALLRSGLRLERDVIKGLDARIVPHLSPARRLCLYYAAAPPSIPDSPEAGFEPRIVPVSLTGGWWTGAIVAVVAVAALGHLAGALASRDWRSLLDLDFVIEAAVLLIYVAVVFGGLLGRRWYFRFSPGMAELLRFKLRASATQTESIPLRRCDVFLDVTRPGAQLLLVDRETGRRVADYELGRGPAIIETCLRAVLSSAPAHALPRGELTA